MFFIYFVFIVFYFRNTKKRLETLTNIKIMIL